ncbi:HDOD domain-containing protein [Alkalimarinus alittae]|uniref:HDOD domain-containing protein n=1 Tax=Alkalimarinus alittae TaxID=2961619 RepID=A0ABY6N5K4_9ALTE|nr:HDOD domain-containing protein [Alkalimarinus alittae]UZE97398.1 HDOD domain-containing protein [Alkalimarinus alittae]
MLEKTTPDSIEINEKDAENALKGVIIPPHPYILQDIAAVYPDIEKISSIIIKDPSVAGAIIKVVNSAAFSLAREIESVQEAVTLLGLDSVINVVNAVLLKSSFQETVDMKALESFWQASDDAAVAAGFIAKDLKLCKPDTAYMVGLFHDCGVPLMMQKHKNYLSLLHKIYGQDQHPFTVVESHLYKTNHADLGFFLARSWKLPKMVTDVIKHHHNVDLLNKLFGAERTETTTLMAILKLAEYVTKEFKTLGQSEESYEWLSIKDSLLDYLGICELDVEDLREKAIETIEAGTC